MKHAQIKDIDSLIQLMRNNAKASLVELLNQQSVKTQFQVILQNPAFLARFIKESPDELLQVYFDSVKDTPFSVLASHCEHLGDLIKDLSSDPAKKNNFLAFLSQHSWSEKELSVIIQQCLLLTRRFDDDALNLFFHHRAAANKMRYESLVPEGSATIQKDAALTAKRFLVKEHFMFSQIIRENNLSFNEALILLDDLEKNLRTVQQKGQCRWSELTENFEDFRVIAGLSNHSKQFQHDSELIDYIRSIFTSGKMAYLAPNLKDLCKRMDYYNGTSLVPEQEEFLSLITPHFKKLIPLAVHDIHSYYFFASNRFIGPEVLTQFLSQEQRVKLEHSIEPPQEGLLSILHNTYQSRYRAFEPFLFDLIFDCQKSLNYQPLVRFIYSLGESLNYGGALKAAGAKIMATIQKNVDVFFPKKEYCLQFEKDVASFTMKRPGQWGTNFFKSLINPPKIENIDQYISSRTFNTKEYFNFGSRLFGGIDRKTKLDAAHLLKTAIESGEPVVVSEQEYKALTQGRLAHLAKNYLHNGLIRQKSESEDTSDCEKKSI